MEQKLITENPKGHSVAGWTRPQAVDRGQQKITDVIRWLGWFDYSDRATLAAMLGVSKDGQSAFFKRLEASGFVTIDQAPGIRKAIYTLGDAGFEYASMLLPELELKRRRRLPAWVTLIHSFSVQAAVVARMSDVASIKPEKALKYLRAIRLPDAILTLKDGTQVALEVELNHKSSARVYSIYLSHLKNIRNNHYDRVVYLFPNHGLCELYRDKFVQPVWPIYRSSGAGGKLVQDPQQSFNSAAIQEGNLFTFDVETMYSL